MRYLAVLDCHGARQAAARTSFPGPPFPAAHTCRAPVAVVAQADGRGGYWAADSGQTAVDEGAGELLEVTARGIRDVAQGSLPGEYG
jgi:hypothetical protein